ncbi:hypothetical protein QAD02_013593 [Eretmocerus hayati]|uniref:Uncharacterized protein n=1 Tax=Eretmocerus hayati TaxID=131215 RepID=A0ACC2P417_9HYME|nr:hypothetical protein QAD02_013593 [Eretmocerus hayati]
MAKRGKKKSKRSKRRHRRRSSSSSSSSSSRDSRDALSTRRSSSLVDSEAGGRASSRDSTPDNDHTGQKDTELPLTSSAPQSTNSTQTVSTASLPKPNAATPTSQVMTPAQDSEPGSKLDLDKSNEKDEELLSEEVMNVLGKRLQEERVPAEPVHSSLSSRWADIFKLGLPQAERVELVKKYPPPKNCLFLDPPKLNAEVNLAMNETTRSRDGRIVERQEKLGACVSAISKLLSPLLVRRDPEDNPIIECLSDACRLLMDAIHDEISVRRKLVVANVSSHMKETLSTTAADEYLFGKKLAEDLKTAKIIGQSAADLKPKKPQVPKSKNPKGPPRQQNKPIASTSGGQKPPTSTTQQSRQPRSQDYHHRPRNSSRSRSSQKKDYSKKY